MNLPYNTVKPLIIVCGHFGSGKTNVSVSLALALKKSKKRVTLIDLDIVNPYFRAADAEALLSASGIRCINPLYANSNVDVPSLGAEVRSAFDTADDDSVSIFDVGGDNGAAALGQYRAEFERLGYDMLCVINKFRPLTENPGLAVNDIREIEYYARLKCTHVVNNSNLGAETTLEDIKSSFEYAEEVCRMSGLNEAFTSVVNAPFCRMLESDYPGKNFFFMDNTTKKLF